MRLRGPWPYTEKFDPKAWFGFMHIPLAREEGRYGSNGLDEREFIASGLDGF